ncbi:hypothetical protein BSKO_03635 [Bryopsis sp. KO-2023]|nr:hypothetical protein BSKO_03635 [Bryopsis sp. KO-2023]
MVSTRFEFVLLAVALLSAVAIGQEPGEDVDECLATAFAETDPNSATADALSNAFANALSRVVQCDETETGPGESSGISVAVAIAISESRVVGQSCSAFVESQADVTSRFLTETLSEVLRDEVEGDSEVLATAWLEARGPDITEAVRAAEVESEISAFDSNGCLNLVALSGGLPTATDLGEILVDAVNQITRAINCRDNIVESEDPCTWNELQRSFFGRCLSTQQAISEADRCREQFRSCQRYQPDQRSRRQCLTTLRDCLRG